MSQYITRQEQYLSAIANGTTTDIKPITRKELFLAKASGQSVAIPEPITREEAFLQKIALNGAGGGSLILSPLSVDKNGKYYASSYGADGFSSVDVNVEVVEGSGNCAPVEGTAIPVGEAVERIYFNTNLSVEETNAYLSQLTYVQTPLADYPLYLSFVDATYYVGTVCGIMVAKRADDAYIIGYVEGSLDDLGVCIIYSSNDGWGVASPIDFGNSHFDLLFVPYSMPFRTAFISVTDFNGIPVGAENEKIKNVLSITPFGAGGSNNGSNTPTAYHLTSADELPTDAVDGSLAVVESDSLIGEWEWKDNTVPLDLSMLNIPIEDDRANIIKIVGKDNYTRDAFGFFRFANLNGDMSIEIGHTLLYVEDSFDDSYDRFYLYSEVDEEASTLLHITADDFNTFIKTNCNRISGGHTLYSRENGEWVNKGEI